MARTIQPIEERFWAMVQKSDGCWEWLGPKTQSGHGRLSQGLRGGGKIMAHRFSFELANGPIPDGMVIDHTCHTPNCVNPAHLRACSQKQNMENRRGAASRSTSEHRGVSWDKKASKWVAYVTHNGVNHYCGYFDAEELAAAAARAKRNELFTHNDMDRQATS